MVFEYGVKNIQAAAYNGARTVTKMKINTYRSIISSKFSLYQGRRTV